MKTSQPCHSTSLPKSGLIRFMLTVGIFVSLTFPNLQGANTFITVNSLNTGRNSHTSTLLANGNVLVAGGSISGGYTATAELYDPSSGTWTITGALATPRNAHTATLLPSGKVLVVGGYNSNGVLASPELYDPVTGTWTPAGSPHVIRHGHSATLLSNGKVLVVGGANSSATNTAELYDPGLGSWTYTGALTNQRYIHTATLLPNGKVLVAGGNPGGSGAHAYASAEIYDPSNETWTSAGAMTTGRNNHTATLLLDGKLLVVGGFGNTNGSKPDYIIPLANTVDVYDPTNGTWTASGALSTSRGTHTASLLSNGKVLVTGGGNIVNSVGQFYSSSELYDPGTGTWSMTGSLNTQRQFHTSTLLNNTQLLVAGGYSGSAVLASSELYGTAITLPAVTTPTSASITDTTATLGGNVTSDGNTSIMAQGVVYAPTSTNSNPQLGGTGVVNVTGVGATGVFTVSATSLTPNTAYSFKAYVTNSVGTGYTATDTFTTLPSPDITVEQPVGTTLASGDTQDFGTTPVGMPLSLSFTIQNTGGSDLVGLSITKDGSDPVDFTVMAFPATPVVAGGSTVFTVQFDPANGATGSRSATLHIANNVPGKSPYNINLTGQALSYVTDTDGDGLNDASEFNMAELTFDWQVNQTSLVNVYKANANSAGYYTLPQLQELNVGTPLLTKDPVSGQFKLSIGLEKSSDLSHFTAFPFDAPQTSVNDGRLEFLFTSSENAAFFKLNAK